MLYRITYLGLFPVNSHVFVKNRQNYQVDIVKNVMDV